MLGRDREQLFSAIRQLHWLGKTAAEAAASLGLKIDTVNLYRRQVGLPPFELPLRKNTRTDTWRDDEDAFLKEAIDAGLTAADVAKHLGRPLKGVEKRRYVLGLPYFKRRAPAPRSNPVWTPEKIRLLAELRTKGMSFRRCAPAFRSTIGAIAGACDRYLKQDVNP